jgi:hypothetical protein
MGKEEFSLDLLQLYYGNGYRLTLDMDESLRDCFLLCN